VKLNVGFLSSALGAISRDVLKPIVHRYLLPWLLELMFITDEYVTRQYPETWQSTPPTVSFKTHAYVLLLQLFSSSEWPTFVQ